MEFTTKYGEAGLFFPRPMIIVFIDQRACGVAEKHEGYMVVQSSNNGFM